VLKIDRIERARDSSLLVIDYKTGARRKCRKNIAEHLIGRLKPQGASAEHGSFQLPLYLVCAARGSPRSPRVNAALYNLRIPELDYFLKDGDATDDAARSQTYEQALGALVAEIQDPRTCFEADADNPHYCSLCPFFTCAGR